MSMFSPDVYDFYGYQVIIHLMKIQRQVTCVVAGNPGYKSACTLCNLKAFPIEGRLPVKLH